MKSRCLTLHQMQLISEALAALEYGIQCFRAATSKDQVTIDLRTGFDTIHIDNIEDALEAFVKLNNILVLEKIYQSSS